MKRRTDTTWQQKLSTLFVLLITAAAIAAVPGCARRSVVITKGSVDEREGVKGSCVLGLEREGQIHRELCETDLPSILRGSKLTAKERSLLYGYICSESGTPEEIRAFYQGLSAEKRLSLMRAFERYGYYFNAYG